MNVRTPCSKRLPAKVQVPVRSAIERKVGPRLMQRDETFEVQDGHLISKVVPRRGEPYEHRCLGKAFGQVAFTVDEAGDKAFTLQSLVQGEELPFTQVAAALAFLKERGIVETRYRRNYAATQCAHLDAMTEFFALAENG